MQRHQTCLSWINSWGPPWYVSEGHLQEAYLKTTHQKDCLCLKLRLCLNTFEMVPRHSEHSRIGHTSSGDPKAEHMVRQSRLMLPEPSLVNAHQPPHSPRSLLCVQKHTHIHTHTGVHTCTHMGAHTCKCTHIYMYTNTSLSITNCSWPRWHFLQRGHDLMNFQQKWNIFPLFGSFLANSPCLLMATLWIIYNFTRQAHKTNMLLYSRRCPFCLKFCRARLNLPHSRILHDKQLNLVIFQQLFKGDHFSQRTHKLLVLYSYPPQLSEGYGLRKAKPMSGGEVWALNSDSSYAYKLYL